MSRQRPAPQQGDQKVPSVASALPPPVDPTRPICSHHRPVIGDNGEDITRPSYDLFRGSDFISFAGSATERRQNITFYNELYQRNLGKLDSWLVRHPHDTVFVQRYKAQLREQLDYLSQQLTRYDNNLGDPPIGQPDPGDGQIPIPELDEDDPSLS